MFSTMRGVLGSNPRNLDTVLKACEEQRALRDANPMNVIRSTNSTVSSNSSRLDSSTTTSNNDKIGFTDFDSMDNDVVDSLWIQRLLKMKKVLAKATDLEIKRRSVGSRESVTLSKNTASTLCGGDIRLANVKKCLDSCGIIRSSDQIAFHDAFIA